MNSKLLEIRDRGTTVPALALEVSCEDGPIMRRAGFGENPCIYLIMLATEKCKYDPFAWNDRTMNTAHQYIEREWHMLRDGSVVDVEFILGERATQKTSELTYR